MQIYQKEFYLNQRKRGFHIITNEILSNLPEISAINTGMLNVFINILQLHLQ